MNAVPLEVGKETIQPSPKVIAGIEFARYTVVILYKVNLCFAPSDGAYEVFGHCVGVPFESFRQGIQDSSRATRE